MDKSIPSVDIELPEVDQVGLAVNDLADAMDRYGSILGVEPWSVLRFEPPALTDRTYYGEPGDFTMDLAIAHAGETMIELIEPTGGENVYSDFLEEHGEGLHHVAYLSWDEDEALEVIDKFEAAGMPVIQSGTFHDSKFWYLDTTDELNGTLFELGFARDMPDPLAVYPDDPYPV